MKKILFWINCYGGWTPDERHPIEMAGYDQYLNGVVEKIVSHKSEIADVYLSGGMYDSIGKTECQTVKPELEQRLKMRGLKISIKTDEESVTSASIMKQFLTMWQKDYAQTLPVIFVDKVRAKINAYTFNHFCKELGIKNLKDEDVIVGIERPDTHPHSTPEAQDKKLELMKEKGVDYVEALERELAKSISNEK